MRKTVKKLLAIFFAAMVGLSLITLLFISPIREQNLTDQSYYKIANQMLDTLKIPSYFPESNLQAGWSRKNITPAESASLAGYKPRSSFSSVLDSLFVRVIVLSNGSATIALVSLDLLLFPPEVKNQVTNALRERESMILPYFSATHTHNGTGNWESSPAGYLIAGKYSAAMVKNLSSSVLEAIDEAYASMSPAYFTYFKEDAHEFAINRLDQSAPSDGFLRGIQVRNQAGFHACLVSYAAHPTSLPRRSRLVSGDYPASLVHNLDNKSGYDFTMFMAGMVGSHSLANIPGENLEKRSAAGKILAEKVPPPAAKQLMDSIVTIQYGQFEVPLPKASMRLGGKWQVRPWVFNQLFSQFRASITLLRLGNLVFMGMPGDFSGELYLNQIKDQVSHPLIITSFNGDFVGYIIDDKHYWKQNREEVTVMNWLGPQGGAYFAHLSLRLLEKLSPAVPENNE